MMGWREETTPKMADLIEGIIPEREVSILAGASGVGKTTLIQQVLASAQKNVPAFGMAVAPNLRLGYIAADRSWDSYIRTAKSTDLDLTSINIKSLIDDESIDLRWFKQDPLAVLQDLIRKLQPIDLVVVDPLVVFLGVDTNKYHLNAAALIELNRFCRSENVTILGTHHATKARSDYTFKRAQDRISGSSALLGFTSTQLFIAGPDEVGRDDGIYEWYIISHHAPGRVVELDRKEGLFTFHNQKLLNAPMNLEDEVVEYISIETDTVQRADIVDKFKGNVSVPTIDRLLKRLVMDGVLKRTSGRYSVNTY